MLCSLAISIALAVAPATGLKPRLEVRISPRVAILDPQNGTTAIVTIIMFNVNEAYWCPGISLDWGTGERPSYHEADCKPFEESAEDERIRWSDVYSHTYTRSGTFRVMVTLVKSGKRVKNGKRELSIEIR